MFKKLLIYNLILLLLLCCGCSEAQSTESQPQTTEIVKEEKNPTNAISLLFCSSDTLNPYTAQTEINRQLCRLLFDPLIKTDNEFNPVYCLAKKVSNKGKSCTVTLRDARFADGSAIRARDVVYSFNLAKDSKSSYAYKLYNIEGASATGAKTVKFELSKRDPFCENVLDFPIIKSGSDKRTDSDGVVLPCISSGRYTIPDNYSSLSLNSKYYGKKGNIKKINLQIAPDEESISHYIEIGAADIYYTDVSDGNIIRMTADKHSINLNNLVYIGINSKYAPLKSNDLRHAISSALNREAVCTKAYYSNALAATGFFNPAWNKTASVQNIQTEANLKITVENLSKIGYNNQDREGYYVNASGYRVQLSLLVNSNNSMRVLAAGEIANQLKAAGIDVTVVKQPYKEYKQSLKKGNFQLYLGEVNITPNMDMSELVTKGSGAVYGLEASSKKSGDKESQEEQGQKKPKKSKNACKDIVDGFYKGVNTINDVATTLQTELPLIPVCYRTGVLFSDEDIHNVENSSASDIYFSIQDFTIIK